MKLSLTLMWRCCNSATLKGLTPEFFFSYVLYSLYVFPLFTDFFCDLFLGVRYIGHGALKG